MKITQTHVGMRALVFVHFSNGETKWEGFINGKPVLIAGEQLDNGRVPIRIANVGVINADRKLVRVLVR